MDKKRRISNKLLFVSVIFIIVIFLVLYVEEVILFENFMSFLSLYEGWNMEVLKISLYFYIYNYLFNY